VIGKDRTNWTGVRVNGGMTHPAKNFQQEKDSKT